MKNIINKPKKQWYQSRNDVQNNLNIASLIPMRVNQKWQTVSRHERTLTLKITSWHSCSIGWRDSYINILKLMLGFKKKNFVRDYMHNKIWPSSDCGGHCNPLNVSDCLCYLRISLLFTLSGVNFYNHVTILANLSCTVLHRLQQKRIKRLDCKFHLRWKPNVSCCITTQTRTLCIAFFVVFCLPQL